MRERCKLNKPIAESLVRGTGRVSIRFFCLWPLILMMLGCAAGSSIGRLADYEHPLVIETANKVIAGESSNQAKLEKIFVYVRDDIRFGFTEKNNFMKASEVIEAKMGYCNNKATLFLALCKTAEIPARIHFGEAKLDFFRGIYPDIALWTGAPTGSHGWIEVYLDGKWHQIDSYIVDQDFFRSSIKMLTLENTDMGYGLACLGEKCGNELDLNGETYVQMGAVIKDHGVWEDPSEYFASDKYIEIGPMDRFFYPFVVSSINNNIEAIRQGK